MSPPGPHSADIERQATHAVGWDNCGKPKAVASAFSACSHCWAAGVIQLSVAMPSCW